MKTTLELSDRRFLEQLHRLGTGTVQDLCDSLDVTATAVRQRLNRLQALGLVSRETVRAGRGRPHHTYSVTNDGLRQLGDNYNDLALILWREVRRIEEPEVRQQVVNRVRDALVERYGQVVRGDGLDDRMRQLGSALSERGFDVEVDSSGELPILRENNCPYFDLAQLDSGICELETAIFERVLGEAVELTQCCLDGHHCCEFQPAAGRGADD